MVEIEKVGVLGCGLMGHGITQVAAQSGYAVVVREVDEATLAKGIAKIDKQLARVVQKGTASQEDADAVRARIEGTTDYGALADCELVLEAITEDEEAPEFALQFGQRLGKLTVQTKDKAGFIVNRLLNPGLA
jgi:3-hydroxybutyryl-CoA dehydrogenase